jgi:hypothetical protein
MPLYPFKCKFIFTKLHAAPNAAPPNPYHSRRGQIKAAAFAGYSDFCVLLALPGGSNPIEYFKLRPVRKIKD